MMTPEQLREQMLAADYAEEAITETLTDLESRGIFIGIDAGFLMLNLDVEKNNIKIEYTDEYRQAIKDGLLTGKEKVGELLAFFLERKYGSLITEDKLENGNDAITTSE